MSRPALQGAALDLDLSSFRVDAHHKRALQELLKGLCLRRGLEAAMFR